MPASPITFSLEDQGAYYLRQHILLGVSIVFHAMSLAFLIKYTPQKQEAWRNYMLVIQVFLIATDIHMELLSGLVPLFPVPAGYATGILCRLGIPVQVQIGITFLLIVNLGITVILCIFHRHQSILLNGDAFKLSRVVLISAFSYAPLSYCVMVQDQGTSDLLLAKDARNLTWIRQRGCYLYQKRELFETIFVILILLEIGTATPFAVFMFVHMFIVINRGKNLRSARTQNAIKNSVIRLFVQLITPVLLMIGPVTTIFLALAFDGFVSFEQCLVLCTCMLLHPIAHNIFLLSLTPSYRLKFVEFLTHFGAWLIATDVHMELLIEPVPLFPAPAGFTTGILCRLGVPVQVEAGLGMLLIAILGASVILCVFHRHQTILVTGDLFKFSKRNYWIIHALLPVAYAFPPASYCMHIQDFKTTDELLEKDPRNLTWIEQRGCYFYQGKGLFEYIFIGLNFLIIISATFFMAFMFAHMNRMSSNEMPLIKRDNHLRSSRTVNTIRKSVVRLFFQLLTPTILMLTPAAIIFLALAVDNIVSFEQCLLLFTAMLLHPIVHNIFLLSLTPSYRGRVVRIIRRIVSPAAR